MIARFRVCFLCVALLVTLLGCGVYFWREGAAESGPAVARRLEGVVPAGDRADQEAARAYRALATRAGGVGPQGVIVGLQSFSSPLREAAEVERFSNYEVLGAGTVANAVNQALESERDFRRRAGKPQLFFDRQYLRVTHVSAQREKNANLEQVREEGWTAAAGDVILVSPFGCVVTIVWPSKRAKGDGS